MENVLSQLRYYQSEGNYMVEMEEGDKRYAVNLNRYLYIHAQFLPVILEEDFDGKQASEILKTLAFIRTDKYVTWSDFFERLTSLAGEVNRAEYVYTSNFLKNNGNREAHFLAEQHVQKENILEKMLSSIISFGISKGIFVFKVADESKLRMSNDEKYLLISSAYDLVKKKKVSNVKIACDNITYLNVKKNKYAVYAPSMVKSIRNVGSNIRVGNYTLDSDLFY